MCSIFIFFFFFKQKTAYEMLRSLVGSEMCIRDSPKTGGKVRDMHQKRKVVEECDTSRKESPALPPLLYLLVRTRRSQKIHPRASRDRDGPSLWHIVKCRVPPWPRWATTIPPHKTPPFIPIMHLYSRLCQTHISLIQTFLY